MKVLVTLALSSACAVSLNLLSTVQPAAAVSEVEPNNSFTTRQFLPSRTHTVKGFLSSSDIDFFTLSALEPGSPFVAEITSGTFDSILGWLDDTGHLLAVDDDSGQSSLSLLGGIVPKSGNLNLAVSGFADFDLTSNHAQSGSYTLSLNAFTASDFLPNPTLLNGSFEMGNFSGWRTLGQASIETSRFGSEPTEGRYQALLVTGGKTLPDFFLEGFLGLEAGSLSNFGNGNATEGSAIRQTFAAKAGDVLMFDWNFLTHESTPTLYNDFSFVSLNFVSKLADANYPIFTSSLTPFSRETGFNTFSLRIPTTGTYTLGIGVADAVDIYVDSGLLIDNVRLVSVPEPSSTIGLFIFGMFGMSVWVKRQTNTKKGQSNSGISH